MNSEVKKCAYCGKKEPDVKLVQGKIVHIRNKRVVTDINWYCEKSNCHGYDQMAHED